MTVAELIEKLKEYPQDLPVVTWDTLLAWHGPVMTVTRVIPEGMPDTHDAVEIS